MAWENGYESNDRELYDHFIVYRDAVKFPRPELGNKVGLPNYSDPTRQERYKRIYV